MVVIETPRIGEGEDQVREITGYLYRMAQQLQWAFDTLTPGADQTPVTAEQQILQHPEAVFAGIKELIIRSADIVEAYGNRLENRLEGKYAAQSEFGSFQQETAQTLEATSEKLQQIFSSQETISGTLDGLYDRVSAADAYIKTGLLQKDPQPLYGLEIGQRNRVDGREVFDKFARFTSDRLSFFDSADVEVAYISDYKLCITNAEVAGSLTLGGRFKIYAGAGLQFQWIGGEK